MTNLHEFVLLASNLLGQCFHVHFHHDFFPHRPRCFQLHQALLVFPPTSETIYFQRNEGQLLFPFPRQTHLHRCILEKKKKKKKKKKKTSFAKSGEL